MKVSIGELELNEPVRPFSAPVGYDSAQLLVRANGVPLGWIELPSRENGKGSYSPEEIRTAIGQQLRNQILQEEFAREFLPETSDPKAAPISVVICTRDRPAYLDACLERLRSLKHGNYEVIVVDNASVGQQTREVVEKHNARYVRESRPGLDWARNRGVTESSHSIVAFVDDDARADSRWLEAINRAFSDPDVMGVTGLVVPHELETDAQIYFERVYGGMGKGFRGRTFYRDILSYRDLLWASGFGVGANMAFRRSVFDVVGFFDTALDVGTATRGGGDVEFFQRLVARGQLLRYDPRVIVWHTHRQDFPALRKQLASNGYSVAPYLLTCLRNRTIPVKSAVGFYCREIMAWWILGRLIRPGKHSRSLVLAEGWGALLGFLAYPQARREAARLAALESCEGSESSKTQLIGKAGIGAASPTRTGH